MSHPPVVIVPGFTPPSAREPIRLHPRAKERVALGWQRMQRDGIRWVIVSGGAVYPEGTPFTEAQGMADELVRLGCAADRILVEPNARHTTTNLRNAGRIMLDRGWRRAAIATTFFQRLYLAFPELGFHGRCERELGYRVGRLARTGLEVSFEPSDDVLREGPDPYDR